MKQYRTTALTIDRLNLRLPAGYADRADAIAREAARQLALLTLPGGTNQQLAAIAPPPVRIQGGESDRIIARRIASGIAGQLASAPGSPGKRS